MSSNTLPGILSSMWGMDKPTINQTFAENLAYFMDAKGYNQSSLAKASGVSQRSISNYLHPDRRDPTATGKDASAKIAEIQMIAAAMQLEAWELLRAMKPNERDFYKQIEAAYRNLLTASPSKSSETQED